jgi:hypothetical protein
MSVYSYNNTYSLDVTVDATAEIKDWGEARFAQIFVHAGSPITLLTFHTAPEPGGQYYALCNAAGPVTMSVAAGCSYKLPLDIQGSRGVKIVVDAADTVDLSFQEQ